MHCIAYASRTAIHSTACPFLRMFVPLRCGVHHDDHRLPHALSSLHYLQLLASVVPPTQYRVSRHPPLTVLCAAMRARNLPRVTWLGLMFAKSIVGLAILSVV